MKKVLMGNHAASWGARLSRVQMIAAYPITPQTHIVEELSEMCGDGSLKAKFLKVESEHSAMASVIAAESAGVRSFTATSANGLALMHELLHWAAGARLPIVMVNVNLALAPDWNIWADQGDSLAQRDTGWVQFYVEDNQEVLDTVILAYRLAESVSLPVMVCYDAFYLSHTFEPVDIPEQSEVDLWLPSYVPDCFLDPHHPQAFNGLVMPSHYMEMRYKLQQAHEAAKTLVDEIGDSFGDHFGRHYPAVETVDCEDAELVLVTSSSMTSPARLVIRRLREAGKKVGLMKIRMFRPFPAETICRLLRGKQKAVVVDRNFSWGGSGIFAAEIRAALANERHAPVIHGYISGLGGKSVTPERLTEMVEESWKNSLPRSPAIWKGISA